MINKFKQFCIKHKTAFTIGSVIPGSLLIPVMPFNLILLTLQLTCLFISIWVVYGKKTQFPNKIYKIK